MTFDRNLQQFPMARRINIRQKMMKIVCVLLWVVLVPVKGQEKVYIFTRDQGESDPTTTVAIFNHVTLLSLKDVYPSKEEVFKFEVNACAEVLVLLTTSPVGDYRQPFYVVRLDEDPVNGTLVDFYYIYKARYHHVVHHGFVDGPFLNCSEFRKFWITWKNGYITVGKEHDETKNAICTETFMEYTGKSVLNIEAIGIMTNRGSNGQWYVIKNVPMDPQYCLADGVYIEGSVVNTMHNVWSSAHCAAICYMNDNCFGLNHNTKTHFCEIIFKPEEERFTIKQDHDWKFYVQC